MKKLIFLVLVLSSCAPIYVPNVRNSPMFTKGGEFQGTIQVGNGLELQSAVSVSNHIGLMGNYTYINRENLDPDDPEDYHHHKFWEGGIGYFQNDDGMFFEIFAGYGKGKGSSYGQYYLFSDNELSTGKYERYFLQPAFGFNKKIMNVAFVPRLSFVDFSEFSRDGVAYEVSEDPRMFFEPAVIGRVNMANNNFYFTFQAGTSISTSGSNYFDHRPFQLSTGIGFRIGGVKPEKTKRKEQSQDL
ncbi:MAG: hypothetical protein ACOYXT_27710 [Bacteroidota bacterium]